MTTLRRRDFETITDDDRVLVHEGHPCYCPRMEEHDAHQFDYVYLDRDDLPVAGSYLCLGDPMRYAPEPTLTASTNPPVLAAHAWRTNAALIADCHRLGYLDDEDAVLDPTYAGGGWWGLYQPPGLAVLPPGSDFRAMPYADAEFDVVAFDPPYVAVGGRATSTIQDFLARYGMNDAPANPQAVQQLIDDGLAECVRVVRPARSLRARRGLILVKCADYVSSGRLWPGTHLTLTTALGLGCELIDRFEHIGHVRAQPGNRTRRCPTCRGGGYGLHQTPCATCGGKRRVPTVQHHARRNLSTLLVLRAPVRRSR